MKRIFINFATIGLLATSAASAQNFNLSQATGLFTPSFRDEANSTYWGWSSGTFGPAGSAFSLNNPAPTLGVGGLDGTIAQTPGSPIGSSSGNIYAFAGGTINFTLPTDGTVDSGFTTIIIQGQTAFGGFNANNPGSFATINGAEPDLVASPNAVGSSQFWAKYEIASNAETYTVSWTLPEHTSIGGLTVDTLWSSTGFAPDTAAVPEPSAVILLLMGSLGIVWFTRRTRRTSSVA